VRFVNTPAEAEKQVVAEDQAARWWLLEVYDAQKAHKAKTQSYATTLRDLGMKHPDELGWSVGLSGDRADYSATVTIPREGRKPLTLTISADSKITRSPEWDDDMP
jgi:hypothetical protein